MTGRIILFHNIVVIKVQKHNITHSDAGPFYIFLESVGQPEQ